MEMLAVILYFLRLHQLVVVVGVVIIIFLDYPAAVVVVEVAALFLITRVAEVAALVALDQMLLEPQHQQSAEMVRQAKAITAAGLAEQEGDLAEQD
jgi:hypothetical protein